MIAAMETVKSGISVSRAALEHNVPRTTFQDRHLERVEHGNKPGPRLYLSEHEEKELVDFIKVVSSVGYGRTRSQVMIIAESVAIEKGVLRKKKITQRCFRRFCERNLQSLSS